MQHLVVFVGRRLLSRDAPYYATRSAFSGLTEAKILKKLKEALNPQELLVENESHMHNVPKGSETHFRVTVVSSAFEGKNMVQQHALVYAALKEELKSPVHALAIQTSTPDKWESKTLKSPPCLIQNNCMPPGTCMPGRSVQ
uniref:Putative transcriptional regulator bola n=1 Tax=Amblyomma triste TaxID=251400 RepID=A0A023G6V5_AMBTT